MHIPTTMQTVRRVNLWLGTAALATGCLMAAAFGYSMSALHAATLALLSVAVAFLPAAVSHLWHNRRRPTAAVLGTVCAVFMAVEYFSHLGYTVGHRVRDTEETGVVNVRHDDTRKTLQSERDMLQLLHKQLADLTAQHAWAATVTPDGLKAQVTATDEAIRQEERRGGCGPKCLALKKDKAGLEERIATAERASDLGKRIEATQRAIDAKTQTAATSEFRSSKIVSQTKFVSQLATLELEPGAAALTWSQIAIGALIALVTTFLAPVCYYVAFGTPADRKPETPEAEVTARMAPDHSVSAPVASPPVATPAPAKPTSIVILDETLRKWAQTKEARALA
jgi:hypothetical protein